MGRDGARRKEDAASSRNKGRQSWKMVYVVIVIVVVVVVRLRDDTPRGWA